MNRRTIRSAALGHGSKAGREACLQDALQGIALGVAVDQRQHEQVGRAREGNVEQTHPFELERLLFVGEAFVVAGRLQVHGRAGPIRIG